MIAPRLVRSALRVLGSLCVGAWMLLFAAPGFAQGKLEAHYEAMLQANETGAFPYTPATNLLYGLREALLMLEEEGLDNVFARHARHADATRRAVRAWGLETNPLDPREHSNSLTAVRMPDGPVRDATLAVLPSAKL